MIIESTLQELAARSGSTTNDRQKSDRLGDHATGRGVHQTLVTARGVRAAVPQQRVARHLNPNQSSPGNNDPMRLP